MPARSIVCILSVSGDGSGLLRATDCERFGGNASFTAWNDAKNPTTVRENTIAPKSCFEDDIACSQSSTPLMGSLSYSMLRDGNDTRYFCAFS